MCQSGNGSIIPTHGPMLRILIWLHLPARESRKCHLPEGSGRGWEALASATISILFYRDSEILN